MNIDTGEIMSLHEALKNDPDLFRHIEIDLNEATSKQKEEMKVSLYDNKSTLGKKLHIARGVKLSKKERRKIKRATNE